MEWQGRRESDNVENRGGGMRTVGMLGGGGIIIAIIYALLGGDPRVILDQAASPNAQQAEDSAPQENDQTKFIRVVLADTEDVWNKVFADHGQHYVEPKLVLFSDQVRTGCGLAGAAVGPFYCPQDQKVYLDLSFFRELSQKLGASGDFAQAYVVAHEVGHHVQNLLGETPDRANMSGRMANQESVKIELQADCYAGIWAKETDKMHHSLQQGDIEEAINAASAVGDDKLQRASQGRVVPDSFTHGSSAQRMAAFQRGYQSGDLGGCAQNQGLNATR